jgi:hypothetical protein
MRNKIWYHLLSTALRHVVGGEGVPGMDMTLTWRVKGMVLEVGNPPVVASGEKAWKVVEVALMYILIKIE